MSIVRSDYFEKAFRLIPVASRLDSRKSIVYTGVMIFYPMPFIQHNCSPLQNFTDFQPSSSHAVSDEPVNKSMFELRSECQIFS